jgi:hypothetical protein
MHADLAPNKSATGDYQWEIECDLLTTTSQLDE